MTFKNKIKALEQTGCYFSNFSRKHQLILSPDNTSRPDLSTLLFQFFLGCTKDGSQVAVTWTVTT